MKKSLLLLFLGVLCLIGPAQARLPDETVKKQVAEANDVNSCAAWLLMDGMRWSSQEAKAKGAQYLLCNCQKAMQGKGTPPHASKYQAQGVSLAACSESAQSKTNTKLASGCGGFEVLAGGAPQMVIPWEGGLGYGGGGAVGAVMKILKDCPECTWRVTNKCGGM